MLAARSPSTVAAGDVLQFRPLIEPPRRVEVVRVLRPCATVIDPGAPLDLAPRRVVPLSRLYLCADSGANRNGR